MSKRWPLRGEGADQKNFGHSAGPAEHADEIVRAKLLAGDYGEPPGQSWRSLSEQEVLEATQRQSRHCASPRA